MNVNMITGVSSTDSLKNVLPDVLNLRRLSLEPHDPGFDRIELGSLLCQVVDAVLEGLDGFSHAEGREQGREDDGKCDDPCLPSVDQLGAIVGHFNH